MNLLRCYRGSVNSKSTLMDREAIKNLSTRQKVSWWIEKLSRSYRDKFQRARWIKIALTTVKKRRKRGSIDVSLSRICRKAIKLEENRFFKERKNTHVKLSKTTLNKKMQNIHDPKHTHTQNKSNQFYISKTSYDNLLSIH